MENRSTYAGDRRVAQLAEHIDGSRHEARQMGTRLSWDFHLADLQSCSWFCVGDLSQELEAQLQFLGGRRSRRFLC